MVDGDRSLSGKDKHVRWKRAARVLVVGIVLLFLGLNIYRGWRHASRVQLDVRPWLLVASFILALAFWFMTGVGWNLMVRCLGGRLALRKGMKVYFLSNLGWYVPGKVWYAVGRAYLGRQEGISAGVISTSVLMEMVISLTSSALMATLALPLLFPFLGVKGLYLGIAVLVLGLVVLHPAPMRGLLALLGRILGGLEQVIDLSPGYPVTHHLFSPDRQIRRLNKLATDLATQAGPGGRLRYSAMLGLLVGYLFIWGFVGTAFFVMLNAVYPLSLAWLPTVAGIYAASWIAGFLTPSPSGWGVREGAAIFLLGNYLPVPAVTAAAILFRLWLTLAEVVWAVVASRW